MVWSGDRAVKAWVALWLVVVMSCQVMAEAPNSGDASSKLASLEEAQQEFVSSGEILTYIPERQWQHELASRDIDSLRALVNDLMTLAAEMGYDPQRDMGAIPLNLASKRFNQRPPTPAPLRDFEREPGPFGVHRYQFPKSGVPTFAGADVAIYPEDLVAGKVDVAFVGVPSNQSSGRRDASAAPVEMRSLNTIGTADLQSLLRPLDVLAVVDYGNVYPDWTSPERSVKHISEMMAETAATGAVPMIIGGDTSILYPSVVGVAQAHGAEPIGLLHFSAHPDVAANADHTLSDRRALFRLLEDGIVEGEATIEVGLRGPDVTVESLQWLRDQGVRYHTMAEVRERGFEKVAKRVLREVKRAPDKLFLSIDVSAITPTQMIAAGRASPGGMQVDQLVQLVRTVCASKVIVGFEITDLAPMMDLSRLSVMHANAIVNACLGGMAVRKQGLDADYIHPLVLDHGQR